MCTLLLAPTNNLVFANGPRFLIAGSSREPDSVCTDLDLENSLRDLKDHWSAALWLLITIYVLHAGVTRVTMVTRVTRVACRGSRECSALCIGSPKYTEQPIIVRLLFVGLHYLSYFLCASGLHISVRYSV